MTLDFVGKELNVGDEVIIINPDYRSLQKCVVRSVTTKCVFVEYIDKYKNEQILRQLSTQVVKV